MRNRNRSLAPKHNIIKKQYQWEVSVVQKSFCVWNTGNPLLCSLRLLPVFQAAFVRVAAASLEKQLRQWWAGVPQGAAQRSCKRTPLAQAPLVRLKQATLGSSQTTNLNTTSRRKGSSFHLQQHVWRGNATPYRTIKPRCFGFLHAKTAATHECSIRDYCSPCRANCKFSILSWQWSAFWSWFFSITLKQNESTNYYGIR